MRTLYVLLPLLLSTMIGVGCGRSSNAADLAIGDPAPEFTLAGSDGKVHRLTDYRGTAVVLAWFPKAFTGG